MNAIEQVLRSAGVMGWIHVADIDSGNEVAVRADESVVLASVFKLPLLLALYRQAERGVVDLSDPVRVPADGRTAGGTGLSAMNDEVAMSLRDIAYLMMAVSDNTAADVLLARVGLDSVNALLAELGLPGTKVVHDCRELFAGMMRDAGVDAPAELTQACADPEVVARLGALVPGRTNRGTPREMTRLLGMVWRDEAARPESCAAVRRLMGLQVWPHRLASGFPFDDVAVSGKTGTLPTIRSEIGVVEYPDGGRYAAAVFTRSLGTAQNQPRADAAIGSAARIAIDHLRAHT
ncbi:serine hydrolase [Planotetraspora phitsanulokensis]|uniref:Serine hydrolase n=1 Tax=Planotetraspora phitsanulokensis TaxID=575192 RepID=A0A8J3U9P0_9ACTN|nr:serine hydrolase [Planotetraspora phitsanulokensis]GII40727.1 serine hydrolase [Planotetraspora phitsanulokensis]